MAKLTIIVGLPGAGKTSYCKKIDKGHFGNLFHNSHRYGPRSIAEVVAKLKDGQDCLTEDSYFCVQKHRQDFERWIRSLFSDDLIVEWHFFENAPGKCLSK